MYNNAELQIKINEYLSDKIDVTECVLQGVSHSPVFFAIYANDIWSYFLNRGLEVLNIDGQNSLLLLVYADNMILMGNSQIDTTKKLLALQEYCKINLLKLNINKTQILVFCQGRTSALKKPFQYSDSILELVNKFSS